MRSVFFLFFTSAMLPAAEPALPAEWLGVWKGTLTVANVGAKTSEVAMQIEVAAIPDSTKYRWEITYGTGAKGQVRKYELVPTDDAGRFTLDEKNSILLDVRLKGDVMYSQFEVAGNHLTARYERVDGAIKYEITTCNAATETGGQNGVPKVKVYPVTGVQTATLKKQ